jgi:ABC-type dipeptide/oligopeptide/nickel transport system permease component
MSIERGDLEAKLREIEQVVEETKESAKNTGVIVAVAVVVIIALAFFFGRRKGSKAGGARVEVYRLR